VVKKIARRDVAGSNNLANARVLLNLHVWRKISSQLSLQLLLYMLIE